MNQPCDLLFELGCEELPPKSLLRLRDALREGVIAGLDKAGLAHAGIEAYAAPRRLAVLIRDLAAAQPDQTVERRGPALKAAYRPDGEPSPALIGFLNSCGATPADVQVLKTDKGEWVAVTQRVQGAPATALIPGILREALAALPIARRMRWGDGEAEFVRPVHWAVLLYGEEVIGAEFYGVPTGRSTRGHRFHHPAAIELARPADYLPRLQDPGHVLADFEVRRERVRTLVEQAAHAAGGRAILGEDLLDEVTALVEWPVPIVAGFEERFLAVPREALIATMQGNQKYFPLEDAAGRLLPRFVTLANVASSNPEAIRIGNERVVRPRLADAEFFWNQDRQTSLDARVPRLAAIVFQDRLGSLGERVVRIESLAGHIARLCGADEGSVERAAHLCKADLLTEMVGEFPELQGTMGRYYAAAEGEPVEIATAIEEHYYPRQSGGALPSTRSGQILAMADRIDLLAGIHSAGLIPTGDKDPYGLRRAALGLVRILLECRYDLDARELLAFALSLYTHDFERETTLEGVWGFVLDRMRGYCLERGATPDEWEAVSAVAGGNLLDLSARLDAVRVFRRLPEADALAAANKRIRNILRKSEAEVRGAPDPALYAETPEQALHQAAAEAQSTVQPLLAARDYTAALQRLAALRTPADAFFDHVLVNAEDAAVRMNRFRLLAWIEGLFLGIADVGRLQPRSEQTGA